MDNNFMPITLYDELGPSGFRDFINEVLLKEYPQSVVTPYPSVGKDGGIDARLSDTTGDTGIQIKFHEIARIGYKKSQSVIRREFKEWAEQVVQRIDEKKFIFITNVPFTLTTHKEIEEIGRYYKCSQSFECWDQEKINVYFKRYDDLRNRFFPTYTRRVVIELRKKLAKKERKSTEQSPILLANAKQRITRCLVDQERKRKFYFAFLYLLEPVDSSNRSAARRTLRKMFDLTLETECQLIEMLYNDGSLSLAGNLFVVNKSDDAKAVVSEMIGLGAINLDETLRVFG